ncbi:DUF3048 domain-containing protein [Streptomyces sp. NPDC058045]|uniref:DUF3048 domain-containing protein n=1 Tax=Streptomyces sp. NPDC058045 TaxID=3346311 RepID=UPI0036EFE814
MVRSGRLLTAVVTVVLLTAGCTTAGQPGEDGQGSAAPGGPILAVKVDNVAAARPQTALAEADVVYAEQVEGGLSRLMALYARRLPAKVGPVRSARESDLELLRQYERPVLAFSGAQSKLLPLIDAAPLDARPPEQAPHAYFRDAGRAAPHNLFVRPGKLVDRTAGTAALAEAGFRTGPAPSGGSGVTERTVRFPQARFGFTWSRSRHRWLVSMDGRPARDGDGERLDAATVVVQRVRIRDSRFHDFRGNPTPYSRTTGSGGGEVLRDGRVWPLRWSRPSAADGTRFGTGDGQPVEFARGPVWVVLAPAG